MKQLIKKIIGKEHQFNSAEYWEKRYAAGGNSGDGSYGRLAHFKASFINAFVAEKKVESVIEFGCGDGHQLSLAEYPKYLGFDVSRSIIKHCRDRFSNDASKSFLLYDGSAFFNNQFIKADLSLSLDVIYHIVEQAAYQKYLMDLFSVAGKYVLVYSTNYYKLETVHVVHREFSKDVQKLFPAFELVSEVENEFPGLGEQESDAKFFVFKKND